VRVRRSSRHTQLGTVLPLFPGTDRPCHTPLPRPFLQISPLAAPSSRTRSPSPFTLSGSAANTAQRPKLADACVSHRIRRQKLPLQEMFQARLGTRTERPASHQTLYGHCVEIGYNVIRTTSERPDHSMRRAGFQVALECVSLWSTDPIFVRTSYIADEKISRCFVLSNPQRTLRAPEILCGDGSRGPQPLLHAGEQACGESLPAVLRYQRAFAFFVWSSKRSDWSATVHHPSPSVCCPGRHAYLGCIQPLSLPFLPRGSTHFHAALLPVCALQPMPLMLLVAVSCYLSCIAARPVCTRPRLLRVGDSTISAGSSALGSTAVQGRPRRPACF
jgi:hypothetical protein